MDLFIYACIALMIGPVIVYCALYLRVAVDPDFEPPAGALQGLLAVIPVVTTLILLYRGKNGNGNGT